MKDSAISVKKIINIPRKYPIYGFKNPISILIKDLNNSSKTRINKQWKYPIIGVNTAIHILKDTAFLGWW